MVDRINLLLLPYAGGAGGIYRQWNETLPDWIRPVPLTLPGRGARHSEPVVSEWPSLVALLAREIRPYLAQPVALFGHSLGALIALELAHAIRELHHKEVVWLGVSGCIAPSQRRQKTKWLTCSEAEFIEELYALKGTPPELLEHRELLELVLPALRADFHLAGTYRSPSRPPLSMPMLVLGGESDEDVAAAPGNLTSWATETSGPSRIELIQGDHFFITAHRQAVMSRIIQDLTLRLSHLAAADG